MKDTSTYSLQEPSSRVGVLRAAARLDRHRHLVRCGLMIGAGVMDLAALGMAGAATGYWRFGDLSVGNWMNSLALLAPAYLIAALAFRAYSLAVLRSTPRSILAILLALAGSAAISFSAVFALKVGDELSRLQTGMALLVAALLMIAFRVIGSRLIRRTLYALIEERVVVLTDGVGVDRRSGNSLTTTHDVRAAGMVPSLSDPAFFDRLAYLVRESDRVVLSFSDSAERQLWTDAIRLTGLDAEVVADLGDVRPIGLSRWQGHTTLVVSRGPLNLGERLLKRAFDLFVTIAILIFAGPVIAICALLVKLDSPGPAFFVQERVGRNNRSYRCFKLRTMRTDLTDTSGGVSASRTDPRITRIGGILRRTSLDELPQLFNVLLGDMSLVGPRPHALGSRAEGALFWELVPDYWSRHAMKPGVTGLAQVRGFRGATHSRSDIEHRVEADLEYINRWSIWLDLKILIMTFRVAVHHNAY